MRDLLNPVFIGGCGRSGTTLLGSMLGVHQDILCVPESEFKTDLIRFCQGNTDISTKSIKQYLNTHIKFLLYDLDINEIFKNWASQNSFAHLIDTIVKFYGIKHGKESYRLWVDHTPNNIKYASTLKKLYPNALFIHIVRDGRAVTNSIKQLDWGPNTVIKAAKWWCESLCYGLAMETAFTENIVRVHYEDLLLFPEKTLRQLCSKIGITFMPEMLNTYGFDMPSWTQTQHQLVGKSLNTDRLYAWKNSLSIREIEIFEHMSGDLLDLLGYQKNYKGCTIGPTQFEAIRFLIEELWKKIFKNSYRYRRRMKIKLFSSKKDAFNS